MYLPYDIIKKITIFFKKEMNPMNSIKNELKKLKKMSFKDKCWYIKEYYKLHIIIFIIFTLISISLIKSTSKKPPILTTVVINNYIEKENQNKIYNDFYKYINMDQMNNTWNFNTSININIRDPERIVGYEYILKLTALIASRSLDIIISDEHIMDYYINLEILKDLEQVLPKDLKNKLEDNIIYKKGPDGLEKAYYIDITNSPVIKENFKTNNPVYFTIIGNSLNLDNSILFLKYLFNI